MEGLFREAEPTEDLRLVRAVVDVLEIHVPGQKTVKIGLLGVDVENDLGCPEEGEYENCCYVNSRGQFCGLPKGPATTSCSSTVPKAAASRHTGRRRILPAPRVPTPPPPPSLMTPNKVPAMLSKSMIKEKAEKKRLKKLRQKERKLMEKESLSLTENLEFTGDLSQPKEMETKTENTNLNDSKDTTAVIQEDQDTYKNSDSSNVDSSEEEGTEEESISGNFEELDLTSSFVSKAAEIAKRKLEKMPKKEKRKSPVREENQPTKDKPNDGHMELKHAENISMHGNPATENNIKISTELGVLGNKHASVGQFDEAVRYFTDAIKYNPTEYRLFGNRSFCFEKMQDYERALTDAVLSLNMCPGWVKGLYRKGRALAGLKRYKEAAQAFLDVLKQDPSRVDCAQELLNVQIIQLMELGFSQEQSANALMMHGTVNKALEAVSKVAAVPGTLCNGKHPNSSMGPAPVNCFPLATAKTNHLHHVGPKPHVQSEPKALAKNVTQTIQRPNTETCQTQLELFPVWIGNLFPTVTESMIVDLFSSIDEFHTCNLLSAKRCAFINYTSQDSCEKAIRKFNGYELMGSRIVVRYPDRIPTGMGMAKSAHQAIDLPNDKTRQKECFFWRTMGCNRRPSCPYKHIPGNRGIERRQVRTEDQ